jgi:hypothetical protein
MTSVMPSAMPCIRCEKTLVKTGGITGMCKACRAADPDLAQVQRDNHAAMKVEMARWLEDNFEPDPRFGPGIGGAIAVRPKKGSKVFG